MKKLSIIFLFLLLPFLLNANTEKVYKVITVEEWAPYNSVDKNGKPTGYAIDLFEELAKRANIKYEYVIRKNWADGWDTVASEHIDILPNLGIGKKRAETFVFTNFTETFPISIYTRNPSVDLESIESFNTKIVAVVHRNLGERVIRNYPLIKTRTFYDLNDAVLAVLSGECDGIVYPEPLLNNRLISLGLEDKFKKVGTPLYEVKRAVAINKKSSELLDPLNVALKEVKHDGTFNKIYNKWFQEEKLIDLTFEELIIALALIAIAVIIFIFSIVIISFRNRWIYSNNQLQEQVESATAKLTKIKNRYELLLYDSSLGLWDWNLDTNEVFFTPIWKEQLGYKEEELVNKFETFTKLLHPDDRKKAFRTIDDYISTKSNKYEIEFRLQHKKGHYVWILSKGKLFIDKKSKTKKFIGVHLDITKIKKYQEELKLKDEMMLAQSRQIAMGEMISMIAHQWRQPITTIGMIINNQRADLMLNDEISPKELEENLDEMDTLIAHLSHTIDDFRDFFKVEKDKNETCTKELIESALDIVRKSLENNNIAVETDLQGCKFLGFKRELIQVLLNIINNSKDALKEKVSRDKKIVIKSYEDNVNVYITVEDNGGGISSEDLPKIFEPYFTTKGPSYGTGLGLYMSNIIIIQHHQGVIEACNIDGGMEFKITIPKRENE